MNSERNDSEMRNECMKTRNINASRKLRNQSFKNRRRYSQKSFRTNFLYCSQKQSLLQIEVLALIDIMTIAQDSYRIN